MAGDTGTDSSTLLQPKVKWFRCFLNSQFYLFLNLFPFFQALQTQLSAGLKMI